MNPNCITIIAIPAPVTPIAAAVIHIAVRIAFCLGYSPAGLRTLARVLLCFLRFTSCSMFQCVGVCALSAQYPVVFVLAGFLLGSSAIRA